MAKQQKDKDRSSQNRLALGLALGLIGGALAQQTALGLVAGVVLGSLPWGSSKDGA